MAPTARLLPLLLVAALAPASAASAQDRGVAPMPAGQPAAAVNASGDRVLAGIGGEPAAERLVVATRTRDADAWTTIALGRSAPEIRDPQAVMTASGRAVVVWAQASRTRQELRVATAAPGRAMRTVQTITVSTAWSASPRLAVLRSGAVLLAHRHRAQVVVRILRPGAVRFGGARVVGSRASSVALTAAGGGAVVAWTSPVRRAGAPRTAYSRRLGGDGRPRERAVVISRDSGGRLRLAGAENGRSIVSWVRPGRGTERAPAAFTRSLRPVLRPARPLGLPGVRPRSPATLAMQGHQALAALDAFGENPFGFRVLAAGSRAGGVWTGVRELGRPTAMGGVPRPAILPDGREIVAWTSARSEPGAVVYDVNLTAATGTAVIGTTTEGDGRGLVLAQAGGRVLVAWPDAAGLAVAETG